MTRRGRCRYPRSRTPAGARGVTPFSNSCHEYTPFGPLRFLFAPRAAAGNRLDLTLRVRLGRKTASGL